MSTVFVCAVSGTCLARIDIHTNGLSTACHPAPELLQKRAFPRFQPSPSSALSCNTAKQAKKEETNSCLPLCLLALLPQQTTSFSQFALPAAQHPRPQATNRAVRCHYCKSLLGFDCHDCLRLPRRPDLFPEKFSHHGPLSCPPGSTLTARST